jgi:subtilisin family serine protease
MCAPNDPDFPQQWALPDLNYPAALCRAHPTRIPAITYLDSGVNPVYPIELALVQQFNFANGADGVREFPFDSDTNENTYHGTGTSSTAGATTNDNQFIAGVASVRQPVFITMLRMSDPPGTVITTESLEDGFAWCLDHQLERGGPGPINVSINAPPPNTLNTYSVFQSLAQSLQAQGDLIVNGAGNSGTEDSFPEQYIRRVAGTDESNELASFSTYGPSIFAAAPATDILVLTGPLGDTTTTEVSGTSLATPYWAGSIAFLMASCPKRNAVQADAIIFNTATITSPTGPLDISYHIPNLNNALNYCQ